MMFAIFYELGLWILAIVCFPRLLYQRWKFGKYRQSLAQRLGSGFPSIRKGDQRLVWIHAVSVGETKAIVPLAKMIKQELDHVMIVISSVTETGHAEAVRSIPFADYHVYLPLDFRLVVTPLVLQAKPDLVLLAETDLWYNFLSACKKGGASIAVVNGKISERSLSRYKMAQFFANAVFSMIDLFCVQNTLYEDRLKQLHVPAEKIVVTGNTKFDEEYPQLSDDELHHWRDLLGIGPGDPVLVVGSTHDPEEEVILDVLQGVWKQFPRLKVLMVPRHPERFSIVANILVKKKVPFVRISSIPAKTGNESVILIDAMGVLRKCYQLADIALVGGSYTSRIGGHNIIEPCWFGVPVLFGPHMHTQTELVDLVNRYHAGLQVPIESLRPTLIDLLNDPAKRKALGEGGLTLVKELQGATAKTWDAVNILV